MSYMQGQPVWVNVNRNGKDRRAADVLGGSEQNGYILQFYGEDWVGSPIEPVLLAPRDPKAPFTDEGVEIDEDELGDEQEPEQN